MGSRLHIRTIKMASGERRAMLCDQATGIPLGKPTLFITTNIYLAGREYNTQVSALAAIHFLYLWADRQKLDLEASFAAGKFLDLQQIEALSRDIRLDLRYLIEDSENFYFGSEIEPKPSPAKYRRHRPPKKFKPPVHLNKDSTTAVRFHYVRRYLDWLSSAAISRTSRRDPASQAMLQTRTVMLEQIKQRIPTPANEDLRRGLSQEQRELFLKVIDPRSELNPFKSEFIKIRNQLIGQMLFCLGPRRAEILLIKLEDIDWDLGGAGATIDLKDHPADPTDTRRKRPQFKTNERRVPLGKELIRLLDKYSKLRKKIPGAARHGYLIVARGGAPLSLSSLDDIFYILSRIDGLPNDFSAHILRYTWNDMFSEYADRQIAQGAWTVKDEMRARRYHQGWTENSKMPEKYTRRHIEAKARTLSLEMQKHYLDGMVLDDL